MKRGTDGGAGHLDGGGFVQAHWLDIIPGGGSIPHGSDPKVTLTDCVIPTRLTHQDD